jgi:DNA-binding beta-propeller fold protein YncE
MNRLRVLFALFVSAFMLTVACSGGGEKAEEQTTATQSVTSDTSSKETPAVAPVARKQYVYDPRSQTIFGIDLDDNKIVDRFMVNKSLVKIAYDVAQELIYKGYGEPTPGLQVFDPEGNKVITTIKFPEPVSDMLFHPIERDLFIVSEDSTNFKVFNCDSLTIDQSFPLHVINKGFVGPIRIQPGPSGKVITANGDRASLTEVFTEKNYMQQTVKIHDASRIDYAVFTLDGAASYSCDSKKGMLFKVRFGDGKILAEKDGLDNPRYLQIEVSSNTVVVVVGKAEVLMLHPDTFTEMGRVNLADQGDEILSLEIPPKANFAELTMDYKGVTRWLRVNISNWEVTRLVELL